MRESRSKAPVLRFAVAGILTFVALSAFAADSIMIGGAGRTGVAGEVIRIPVVIDDNAGTPAGSDQADPNDQIRYIAFKATFSNDALVSACGAAVTPANCSFIEAGIAPAITVQTVDSNDPCGRTTGTAQPCYFRSVPVTSSPNTISYVVAFTTPLATSTTAPFGNLVGYLKLKMAAAGPVTISLTSADAYLSGYDVYSNDGNPSSDETVANGNLTVSTYQPADADGSAVVDAADLTKVTTDLQATPNAAVTGTNFRSDCDADGKLTGFDVFCVYTELNPTVFAGTQKGLLDVDADGRVTALGDGLMILRKLFNFTGTTLTSGAVSAQAQRTDPTAILNYINSIQGALDVDGSGSVKALSDGLIILRSLFNFTGTTLTNGAIGTGATRDSAGINTFMTALKTTQP